MGPKPSGGTPSNDGSTVLVAHPFPDNYGADRVVEESVAALLEAGWRVVVTMPSDGPLTTRLRTLGADIHICPTVVLRKAFLGLRGLLALAWLTMRAAPAAWRLLRRIDPDLVYVNTATLPLWLFVARTTRRRVLAHVHEAEDALPRVLRWAVYAPLLAAHVVVANSATTAQVMARAVPRLRGRTVRIHNGVAGPPRPASRRSRVTRPRLVFAGRLSERKGPHHAIAALARLRERGWDASLEIAGSVFPGYESYETSLRSLVDELGVAEHVVFAGFVGDIWTVYERADIALVPSQVESLGNSAIEAMLAGVPVLATRARGLLEVTQDGRFARLVPIDDAVALADAAHEMLSDWDATCAIAAEAEHSAGVRFAPSAYRAALTTLARESARQRSAIYGSTGSNAA